MRISRVVAAGLMWCSLAAQAAGERWDLQAPTLDGDRFMQAAQVKGPLLLNFWGADCPPCREEMPRLQAFAETHRRWTVWLVATDPVPVARDFVQRYGLRLPVLRAGQNLPGALRAAGNRDGALPFTLALRDGRICATHLGALDDAALAAVDAACAQEAGR